MAKKKKPKIPAVPTPELGVSEKSETLPKEATTGTSTGKPAAAVNLPPEGLNRETWLAVLRGNPPLKYGLLAVLYLVGIWFIHSQGNLWGKNQFSGVGLNIFEKVLNRGQAYGIYKPVNMPIDPEELANLSEEEKQLGFLPDEKKILEEMKKETQKRKLSREERAAPEREGIEVLKKEKPQKAPWKKTQFQVLPPSVYGKEASGSQDLSSSKETLKEKTNP